MGAGLIVDRLLSLGDRREKIVRPGRVQQLLGKAALRRGRFEVVLVFGKILGHGDQLAADVVPRFQHRLGRCERLSGFCAHITDVSREAMSAVFAKRFFIGRPPMNLPHWYGSVATALHKLTPLH